MGCGASTTVPCATVKTIPYERLKRPAGDDTSEDERNGPTKVYLSNNEQGGVTVIPFLMFFLLCYE